MINEAFAFSKNLRVILYGVNQFSKRIYRSLRDAGYHVEAFFDQRCEELKSQCPVPVYTLSDNPYIPLEKDDLCVVILLQNAMQHAQIAEELLAQGYHKLLLAPVNSRLRREAEIAYRIQYNIFQTEQFERLTQIPFFQRELFDSPITFRHTVISEEGSYLVVWCPAELLYTDCTNEKLEYANIPVNSFAPYTSLFRYLQGDEGSPALYLQKFGVHSCLFPNSYTNADILAQRKRLLEIYMTELNHGMDFFTSSAPAAKWNDTYRVFNLLDGHHRCSFLFAQGFRYAPIRISRADFDKWSDCPSKFPLCECLTSSGEAVSITHPKYKRINEASNWNHLLQLEGIQGYLAKAQDSWLENQSVLDLSGTHGYYARNALRMRAHEAVSFGRRLNELLYCSSINSVCCGLDRMDTTKRFSFTIMLTVLYWYLDNPLGLEILHNIDVVTEDFLIWESGDRPEEEIQHILKHSSFQTYVKIGETFGTGKVREMGIFSKGHVQIKLPEWFHAT